VSECRICQSDYVPKGCVINSFKHTLREWRRAVQCPSDMIDQIGGWATAGVGHAYGEGYGLDCMQLELKKALL